MKSRYCCSSRLCLLGKVPTRAQPHFPLPPPPKLYTPFRHKLGVILHAYQACTTSSVRLGCRSQLELFEGLSKRSFFGGEGQDLTHDRVSCFLCNNSSWRWGSSIKIKIHQQRCSSMTDSGSLREM